MVVTQGSPKKFFFLQQTTESPTDFPLGERYHRNGSPTSWTIFTFTYALIGSDTGFPKIHFFLQQTTESPTDFPLGERYHRNGSPTSWTIFTFICFEWSLVTQGSQIFFFFSPTDNGIPNGLSTGRAVPPERVAD